MLRVLLPFIGFMAIRIMAHADELSSMPIAGFVGCRDWDTVVKIVELHSADPVASNRLFLTSAAAGECVVFKKGQRVFATDWGMVTQSVQLRPEGDPTEYWTTRPTSVRPFPVPPINPYKVNSPN